MHMIFFQAFVNIGMNIGMMPVTGITLPFAQLWLTCSGAFLIAPGTAAKRPLAPEKLAFQPD